MVRSHSHSLRRWVSVLALLALLFSLATPGGRAAPDARQTIPVDLGNGKLHVIVELMGDPLAALEPAVDTAGPAQALAKEHAQFRQNMTRERIPYRLLSSHTKLFNGAALEIRAADMARVAALPGVKRLHLDRPHNLPQPQLASSVQMIGASRVWADTGFDGNGVTVAVIDTGTSVCHRT